MSTCACRQDLFAVPVVYGAHLITAGVIDDNARAAFTQGQCHALALAMHEATGWPMVAIVTPNEWASSDDMAAMIDPVTQVMHRGGLNDFAEHLLVRRPDGRLVDVNGAHDQTELLHAYEWDLAWPDPVWGYLPPDADEEFVDIAREGWSIRVVAVAADDIEGLFGRPAALDAARTLVPTLLAALDG